MLYWLPLSKTRGHLEYVVQASNTGLPPTAPPSKKKKWEQKTGGVGRGGVGSCQLAANETSLCRYPNLKGANVLQQPPPHPSQLAPQASSVLQTCASPVCPCIPASAAATRGQLWGPSCDYSHMAAAPLSFERPIAKEEKKCLRYGQYKNPPLTHGQGFFIVQLPRPPTPSCAETLTRHLLQIDASIQ